MGMIALEKKVVDFNPDFYTSEVYFILKYATTFKKRNNERKYLYSIPYNIINVFVRSHF